MTLVCPKCGSRRITYVGTSTTAGGGYYATDQKYYCKECGYRGSFILSEETRNGKKRQQKKEERPATEKAHNEKQEQKPKQNSNQKNHRPPIDLEKEEEKNLKQELLIWWTLVFGIISLLAYFSGEDLETALFFFFIPISFLIIFLWLVRGYKSMTEDLKGAEQKIKKDSD